MVRLKKRMKDLTFLIISTRDMHISIRVAATRTRTFTVPARMLFRTKTVTLVVYLQRCGKITRNLFMRSTN